MIRRALLFLGLLAAGCEREHESDPATATKSFFQQLAKNHVDAAFSEAAFFFQHQQSRRDFEASVYEMGLDGCALVKADAPAISGKSAKQHVVIRTNFDVQVPLLITLTRERGAWRVFSVRSPMNLETGIMENRFTRIGKGHQATSVHDNPVPEEGAAEAMAKETMLQFHDAIQQKSFEDFYEGVARSWQRQLTLGMLTRTFQEFIDRRTNLIAIKDLEATLKMPPRIDTDGLLIVSGTYATKPNRIAFDIKYYYELPNWRPFGVAVRILE